MEIAVYIFGLGWVRKDRWEQQFTVPVSVSGGTKWLFQENEDGRLGFCHDTWVSPVPVVFREPTKVDLLPYSLLSKDPFRSKAPTPILRQDWVGPAWSPLFGWVFLNQLRIFSPYWRDEWVREERLIAMDLEDVLSSPGVREWGFQARQVLKESEDNPVFFTKAFNPIFCPTSKHTSGRTRGLYSRY